MKPDFLKGRRGVGWGNDHAFILFFHCELTMLLCNPVVDEEIDLFVSIPANK